MQRTTAAGLGLGFVALVVALVLIGQRPSKSAKPDAKPKASASASHAAPAPAPSASALGLPEVPDDAGATFTEGFSTFPDGGKVPELAPNAPKVVKFGVVQFTYSGAQGAPRDARAKEQARARAAETVEIARRDFSEAVRKGDQGSTADAGRMPRGVLEPPIEYWLFSLEKGAVYPDPIDTPRGYWIVRRNE